MNWIGWGIALLLALVAGVVFLQIREKRRKSQFVFPRRGDLPRLNRKEDQGDVDPSGGVRKRDIPPTRSGSAEKRIPYDNTTN